MVVVDGIVMGPAHCAIENCTQDLVNARQGVFCAMHEVLHKNLCRLNTKACEEHQQKWRSHLTRFGRQLLLGVQRILRLLAWAKFDKSESVDQIFEFLEKVFPTEDVRQVMVTDYICCKWCNPAPLNGSAPNLVVVEHDVNGVPHYKRAFNTQACEQLNAWIGGFQTMLNRMTLSNFNWTMHTLLFLHTQRVIKKQYMREQVVEEDDNEEIGIDIERDD
ncbi:hypothetical protein BDQ17DRAFT_1393532 [Cyathus striatus]|nr:hypothetical protein BDQ17DRAFT_1393532 [Cyathus striatus]